MLSYLNCGAVVALIAVGGYWYAQNKKKAAALAMQAIADASKGAASAEAAGVVLSADAATAKSLARKL